MPMRVIIILTLILMGIMLVVPPALQYVVTAVVEAPLKTDFYSSIPQELVRERQAQVGLRTSHGTSWAHLGWIADLSETYQVQRQNGAGWEQIAQAQFGSHVLREDGVYRVVAVPGERVIGQVTISGLQPSTAPVQVPVQTGAWQTLYQPTPTYGGYLNDHTVYFDTANRLHVVGITSLTDGNYNEEKSFAHAYSPTPGFPPSAPLEELPKVADQGELAWAAHVVQAGGQYHMFYSPHHLMHATSTDGVTWSAAKEILIPYHKFFRDPMVVILEDSPEQTQAILYTTAKDEQGMSTVDLYQSFDPALDEWQFIGSALTSGPGSERNAPFASMESPFMLEQAGRYYMTLTYNNETSAIHGILLDMHIWLDPPTYNDTLVFSSDCPYDFGTYYGRTNPQSTSFVGTLTAHGPEFFRIGEQWYFTTAGWKWVATLTGGELAYAPLSFQTK